MYLIRKLYKLLMNATNCPGLMGVAGIALITIEGLIHFYLVPKYFEYATYLGLLFLTNTFGSVRP